MKIQKFVTGIISTNCYIVSNEDTKEAVVIDPAACPPSILRYIEEEGLKVRAIFLTHGHFDHTMGLDGFLEKFDVPVYAHEMEENILKEPSLNLSGSYTSGYSFSKASYVQDGKVLSYAGYDFVVLHTPGHTPGGVCYYVEKEKVLFSGDTLFQNSVGRTDFPGSSMSELVRGIREKILTLPGDVKVYPGHMGETVTGYEREHNPFV